MIPSALAFNASLYPTPGQIPPTNTTWTKMLNVTNASVAPYYLNCQRSNQWALTYDDGPGNHTAVALDELSLNGIKGTFFVVGSSVLKYPDTLIRAFKDGHEIAIHTWSHRLLTQLTTDQIVAELVWTARLIKDLTGVTPSLMRPPFGGVS
jgi:peptidoglycan/xylan/chitin deacetylase (PgdA/CDA1 family)